MSPETLASLADQPLNLVRLLFAPKGFLGWIYWYAVYPFHGLIFDQLIDRVAELARELAASPETR